jgi:hypothetical protein
MLYRRTRVHSRMYLMKIANLLRRLGRGEAALRSIMRWGVKRGKVLRLNQLRLSTNLHTFITLMMLLRVISLSIHQQRGDQCHKITQITD